MDKQFEEDKSVLLLMNANKNFLAHEQALQGWITKDVDIMLLEDEQGNTLFHNHAVIGIEYDYEEIMSLKNHEGVSVRQIIKNRNRLLDAFIKSEKDDSKQNLQGMFELFSTNKEE